MKIILIGFMGSGKSTISRLLGEKLNFKALDTDDLVEKKSGMTTAEIFDKHGETRYRELEIDVSRELKNIQNHIIATGGGVILNSVIIDYLKMNNGIVIFLKTSFKEIVRRVSKHKRPRPLFKNSVQAEKLYEFRLPIYEEYSDFIIKTDNKEINAIADEIIFKIKQ